MRGYQVRFSTSALGSSRGVVRPLKSVNMGILEKIAEIEREIARTQKNKATEYHLGLLKAKLAKYRVSLNYETGNFRKFS